MNPLRRRIFALLSRLRPALASEVRAWASRGPVRPRTVLYESFAGNGALDNPEAIFRELLRSPDLRDLHHIWVLDPNQTHSAVRQEFAGDDRVTFVEYRSARYFGALATSGYLINNATFPAEFSKREGQIYLNTWHGTPLKRMGYDMPNGAVESANTVRNFSSADYLLSQNTFMTTVMYERAYKLRGAHRGTILEVGYPRVDRQYLDAAETARTRARLGETGIVVNDREIVLYAPTWKGGSFSKPDDDVATLLAAVSELQSELDPDRYIVLLKTHQVVHRYASHNPTLRSILVPNDIPTNTILGLASVLITDYSSIFFDYLATGRPIIFYTPDAGQYDDSRGTYFAPDELPGPVFTTLGPVAEAISALGAGHPNASHPNYGDWQARFAGHDDGQAARRVVDRVFRNTGASVAVDAPAENHRVAVLLHLGGMNSNGITSSALNLLNSIDHDRYDVSIVIRRPTSVQQLANQARIHPAVRQFHRIGGMNGFKLAHAGRRAAEWRGKPSHHETRVQARQWDAEWRRCFGDQQFDVVADFSGYSIFWATLLLHAPQARKLIWLHNDMAAEQHRVISGHKKMHRSLAAVFALYPQFAALVSVSESLAELNRQALGTRLALPATRFVAVRNQIDGHGIRSRLSDELLPSTKEQLSLTAQLELTEPAPTPAWALSLAASAQAECAQVDSRSATDETHALTWFVTVGRYSTEKNQGRLIRAFALVATEHPGARLLLVGYGPLYDTLKAEISSLGLEAVIFLTGALENPYPTLAAADCFVLSSNYEGQPMVLLEAAIAGLPIVATTFGSIQDALPPGQIHIVAATDEALAQGMIDFLDGRVPPASLDDDAYNHAALHEFERTLETAE